jgi:predicted O-methyltransferase YrrM
MDYFLKQYARILLNADNDPTFEMIKVLVGGTTSVRIAKLLNFAVSQIDHDECYLETGVYLGGTLISANRNNGRPAIGIDPYEGMVERADWQTVRDRARNYIQTLGEGATLIEKDFRKVMKEEIGHPVAVSFIDALHHKKDVLDNLEWLHPLLADDALVAFDDINYLEVSQAISEWLSRHGDQYDLTAYIKPFYQDEQNSWSVGDRLLNNGLCILRYHKNPAALGVIKFT